MADVQSHGGAIEPARVCGAVWAKKSPEERRAIVALEEGTTMAKGKKKKSKKKAASAEKRPKKKKKKKKKSHGGRCLGCGHSHKGPCVHIQGGSICPCNRPIHRRAA